MPRILFRCDSSNSIGTGHVTRSLALAEEFLTTGWEVDFCGSFVEPKWLNEFLNSNQEIKLINIKNLKINHSKYDVVCFDSYFISPEEYKFISSLGIFRIWIIDDNSPHFEADLYISYLPEKYLSDFFKDKNKLFGLQYTLIRKSVREIVKGKIRKNKQDLNNKTLAILTGGIENKILTQLFIKNIKLINPYLNLLTNLNEIKHIEIKINDKITNISKNPNLFSKLIDCDYIISPASVTSLEVIYSRIPLAVYGIMENQKITYKFLTESGFAMGLGYSSHALNFNIINQNLQEFLLNFDENLNVGQIDGLGSYRIFSKVINKI